MISNQFILDLNEELIVDNFAGGGGASTGIEMALGRHVDIAINHDETALAMHQENHPQTEHFCEDVFDIDPRKVTKGRPVGLAWFSPDCKHFSKAKGAKPRNKNIRGLAWVMVKWAATVRPRVMVLENVEEFQTWGPLLSNGSPCPKRKGNTFFKFISRLKELGYDVEWKELRACDYGAPTIRKRLFLIARCDGKPIVWPEPTHAVPDSEPVRKKRLKPWRTAAECIDWSIPCPSIFNRKKPLADATLRRIARGIQKFVIEAENPFIVSDFLVRYYSGENQYQRCNTPMSTIRTRDCMGLVTVQCAPFLTECANGTSQRNFDINEPLRTQCAETKGGHFALVSAFLAKHYSDQGQRPGSGITEPVSTITAQDHHSLVALNLVRHFGQSTGQGITQPIPTIVANGGGKTGLVTSHIMKMKGDNVGHPTDSPLHTMTSVQHFAEVRAFLIKYYGNEKEGVDIREPMHTIPTKDRMGLVTVSGEDYCIFDIGMRMLQPHELYKAQGFPKDYIISFDYQGKPLTKTAQVKMVGNSVSPPIAKAIVLANVPEMAVMKQEKIS